MNNKKLILIPVILISTLLLLFFIFTNKFLFINKFLSNLSSKNMKYIETELPKGKFLSESTSEDGQYTIKAYLCNGGSTVDWAVRAELIENNVSKKPHNIYWDYHINKAEIIWEDNNTVIINNHKIDLPNGTYDWRDN